VPNIRAFSCSLMTPCWKVFGFVFFVDTQYWASWTVGQRSHSVCFCTRLWIMHLSTSLYHENVAQSHSYLFTMHIDRSTVTCIRGGLIIKTIPRPKVWMHATVLFSKMCIKEVILSKYKTRIQNLQCEANKHTCPGIGTFLSVLLKQSYLEKRF